METLPTLETFIDKLLKEKAFENVEPEIEAQVKEDLRGRLDDVVNRAMLDELSDSKVSEFEDLLDNGANQDELQKFLSENIGNMEAVLTAALLKFRSLYIA
ncbi:MAG: hypothetical protein ACI88L_000274 [Candidatus Paceibacteria bacterium]|jgi:hypothetical protein